MKDGDRGFIGVMPRQDPSLLDRGMASDARNMRFERGVARPRKGIRKMSWSNLIDTATPNLVLPFGLVHGAAVFRDPLSSEEWLIVAASGGVKKCRYSTAASDVILPAGVTLTGRVNLIQGYGTMLLQRGADLPTLIMTNIDEGFKQIVWTPASGDIAMPDSITSEYLSNRFFVPYDDDLVFVSNIGNENGGNGIGTGRDVMNAFRINQGSDDELVRLFKFNDTTLIAAKSKSIYVISDLYDIPGNTTVYPNVKLDLITSEYGAAAPKAFAQVGADVWFLAKGRGVVSIRQTELNKLQGLDVPMSDDVLPYIEQINWDYAHNATAKFFDNKFYLAVPIGQPYAEGDTLIITGAGGLGGGPYWNEFTTVAGQTYVYTKGTDDISFVNGTETLSATAVFTAQGTLVTVNNSSDTNYGTVKLVAVGHNNAVLVYDTFNRKWTGMDTGDAIQVKEWVIVTYGHEQRLAFISNDGFINLYEDGFYDHIGHLDGSLDRNAVPWSITTRGYFGQEEGWKQFTELQFNVSTWDPEFSVSVLADGVNEETTLDAAITMDRTKYFKPWDASDYVEDNSNDDFLTPYREDYSIKMDDPEVMDGGSGIDPNQHQEWRRGYLLRERGRYAQVKFTGTKGRAEVRGIALHGDIDNQQHINQS